MFSVFRWKWDLGVTVKSTLRISNLVQVTGHLECTFAER